MPKAFKIKKTYAKDKRHDACLRKIAFFNYEMQNNIIMGRFTECLSKWLIDFQTDQGPIDQKVFISLEIHDRHFRTTNRCDVSQYE